MFNSDDYFKIFQFLKDNPDATVSKDYDSQSLVYNDPAFILQQTLVLTESGLLSTDDIKIQTSLAARGQVRDYFLNVLRQIPFSSEDYLLFEKYLIDLFASNKTFIDLMRKANDVFTLSDDEIDVALRGFGAFVVNKTVISDRKVRGFFLLALCELYKIKGTPQSIATAINFIGYKNATIKEWWIKRDRNIIDGDLYLNGIAIRKGNVFDETLKQYKPINEKETEDEFLTWANFTTRLGEIGEPHWQYTNEEIKLIDDDPDVLMKLPSITPYFSIVFEQDQTYLNIIFAYMENLLAKEFNSFLNCGQLIAVTYIEGYTQQVSFIEIYLAYLYAQIKADDRYRTKHLRSYLQEYNVVPPEFSYPFSYEQLILWCSEQIDLGNIELHLILNGYVPSFNHYSSRRDLQIWWDSDPDRIGTDIPEIYFDIFKYLRQIEDISQNKILCYNGLIQIENLNSDSFYKVLNEAQTLLDSKFSRRPFANNTSTTTPEKLNMTSADWPDQMYSLQTKYFNTFYRKIYEQGDEGFTDTTSHDGSTLLVDSAASENMWAVDFNYFYRTRKVRLYQFGSSSSTETGDQPLNPLVNRWCRCVIETDWDDLDNPMDAPPFLPHTHHNVLGDLVLGDDGFIYRYVSCDQWIRNIVERDWTDGKVNPSGTGVRLSVVFDDNYMYECIQTNTWVRTPIITSWEQEERTAIYSGGKYGYPILDLTYHYSADKILRGLHPVNTVADLASLPEAHPNQTVVVCNTDLGDCAKPVVWIWTNQISSSSATGSSIYSWQPTDLNYSEVDLGLNNNLLVWIDELFDASNDDYQSVADMILKNLSAYVDTVLRDDLINIGGSFLLNRSDKKFTDLVNFFKPKRARFLFFSINIQIDDRLLDSVFNGYDDDDIDKTQIVNIIPEYVPRQDLIHIHNDQNSIYNNRNYYFFENRMDFDHPETMPVVYNDYIGENIPWNLAHPRDPTYEASVPRLHGTATKWEFGFCKTFPRLIWPLALAGCSEQDLNITDIPVLHNLVTDGNLSSSASTNDLWQFTGSYEWTDGIICLDDGSSLIRKSIPVQDRGVYKVTFDAQMTYGDSYELEIIFGGMTRLITFEYPESSKNIGLTFLVYTASQDSSSSSSSSSDNTVDLVINARRTYGYHKICFDNIFVALMDDFTHHLPVFIAVQHTIIDCYPRQPVHPTCCDYYDTGCNHDGITNPHPDLWNGNEWVALPESIPQLDPGQEDIGNTFCNECDYPLYTPNLDVLNIPVEWIRSGVFHDVITAAGFTDSYAWVNGDWSRSELPEEDPLRYPTDEAREFRYGYVQSVSSSSSSGTSGGYLVHVYERMTGYHYWELRDENQIAVARSQLKNKQHVPSDFVITDYYNPFDYIRVDPKKYLNGNDTDVSDDTWEDLNGNILQFGSFSSSQWIRFEVNTDWTDMQIIHPNSPGIKGQLERHGIWLYRCIDDNSWVRHEVQTTWTDETFVTPVSDPNMWGYVYKAPYLYTYYKNTIYSSTALASGWCRQLVNSDWDNNSIIPSSEFSTNKIIFSNPYMFFCVFPTNVNEELCEVKLPFLETAEGYAMSLENPYAPPSCKFSVEDSIINDPNILGGFNGTVIKNTLNDNCFTDEELFMSILLHVPNQDDNYSDYQRGNRQNVDGYDAENLIYTGDGVETDFELKFTPAVPTKLEIYIDDVLQIYGIDYTITGTTLSFSSSPYTGSVIKIGGPYINFEGVSLFGTSNLDYVSSTGMVRNHSHEVPVRRIFNSTGTYTEDIIIDDPNEGLIFSVSGISDFTLSNISIKRHYDDGSFGPELNTNTWITDSGFNQVGSTLEFLDSTQRFRGLAIHDLSGLDANSRYQVSFDIVIINHSYLTLSIGGISVLEEDQSIIDSTNESEAEYAKGLPPYYFDYLSIYDKDVMIEVYDAITHALIPENLWAS